MAKLIDLMGMALESADRCIVRNGGNVWIAADADMVEAIDWGFRAYRQHRRQYGTSDNSNSRRRG